jgi:hypothetical protein
MNKVTGGLLPAATWNRIMTEAEKTLTAAALPGLPVEESHIQFAADYKKQLEIAAAQPADEVVDANAPVSAANGSTEPPAGQVTGPVVIVNGALSTSGAQPPLDLPVVRTVLAPLPGEVNDEVVVVKPGKRRDPVAAVFRDMFSLFGSDADEPVKKVRTKKSASELILPSPNTGKTKGSTALQRLRKRNDSN